MRFLTSLTAAFAIAGPLFAQSEARPTIAVMRFVGGSVLRPSEFTNLGKGIAELVTVSLAERSDVRVVERATLDQLLAEQHLAESGQLDPETAVRVGKALGARHFISGGFLVDGRNRIRLDVRAINVETSEIEFRETTEGSADDLLGVIDRANARLAHAMQVTIAAPKHDADLVTKAKALSDSLTRRR